jgi:hypothetical protein
MSSYIGRMNKKAEDAYPPLFFKGSIKDLVTFLLIVR